MSIVASTYFIPVVFKKNEFSPMYKMLIMPGFGEGKRAVLPCFHDWKLNLPGCKEATYHGNKFSLSVWMRTCICVRFQGLVF